MKRKSENVLTGYEYGFIAACKRLGISPYKERYWRKEIALLLGVQSDTINRWMRGDKRSPLPLFIWRHNRRVFAYRKDLLITFQDIVPIQNNG